MIVLEQLLNGVQFGLTLFLMSAGLTLIFGIMGVINLAHGSLYMIGAYAAALTAAATGSIGLAFVGGLAAAAVSGIAIEFAVVQRLYTRNHLDQVLATFALVLIINQGANMLFGRQPLFVAMPQALSGSVTLLSGLAYPVYRLLVIALGLAVAVGLFVMIHWTKVGMLVRAGATHRQMVRALGVNVALLYSAVFGLGALLAGLAGVIAGPITSVQVGMGEQILIQAFVVVVIGGLGSVRGAFFGALAIGLVDTLSRAFLPSLFRQVMDSSSADALASGMSSISIYLLMALVLLIRPQGLLVGRP
ncbi:branched-chain amino acid ABC transporter permease [Bradyrhizobium sp. CIR3A]|uniref:branched-chain amino acid ABC transporter permease n=1 Tax=Bradyrhizobium sp. CIR3A TaxID=2663838 RepID=UPI001605D2F2|nr:branched-chain amino acid ABC transporter permease [Bradyrhizobium sp. CIR3A]MBB4261378.1 branched-chain amino acid transport system permease protein [Bradyrhizobium sp. CIR3A]